MDDIRNGRGMTLEELGEKINHSLGTTTLSGKGYLIANKCIELGVDPYIATAPLGTTIVDRPFESFTIYFTSK